MTSPRCDPFLRCAIALALALPGAAVAQDRAAPAAPGAPAASAAAPQPPAEGLIKEPAILSRALESVSGTGIDGGEKKEGFYPELSNMPTGAGWISIGPGYRRWLFGDRAFADASAAISWRAYKMAQARFELPALMRNRLVVGSQAMWLDATQITYFGNGPLSQERDRSEYRMKTTDVVGYLAVRPANWLELGGRVGVLQRPEILPPAGTFRRGHPAAEVRFADDIVFQRPEQPSFVHADATITADTRDARGHPTRGGVYRAVWSSYADRDAGAFSFRRYEAEAAQFVPLARRRVVLAVHGWLIASDTSDGRQIPFYLMPSLGGGSSLRAYPDFRFHDRHAAVVTVESRFALMTHVDVAAFADAGNVAHRFGDLNLDRRAYGVGLRVHTTRSTVARLDVAHGAEGWRVLLRTSDPLRLSRLARRMAAAPFAP
jgi:hypothetical protein